MKRSGSFLRVLIPGLALLLVYSCGPRPSGGSATTGEYYTEPHRPGFHFSPDSMWMNDPNGMVYFEGEYHLFYQYYPEDMVWGPMHWGHAVSNDLVHWKHLPIALYPDSLGFIFSGSAVIDWNNTSELGEENVPPMIAIFTHHHPELARQGSDRFQYQSIAFSNDKGRNWTKFDGNPVVKNPGIRDFRDPKVIWHPGSQKWVMVFAAWDRVLFYSSPDLIDWELESEFGSNVGAHGGVWECPDIFPLPFEGEEKWVLLVSINPGGPNGGSATQYFIGDFNGSEFFNENPGPEPRWIDYGKDNYAGVTWSDIPESDGRRIFMGWMSNWQYAQLVPTLPWRSAMTLPRRLDLVRNGQGPVLVFRPVKELEGLRQESKQLGSREIQDAWEIEGISGWPASRYEMDLDVSMASDNSGQGPEEFGITLENNLGQQISVGISTTEGRAWVDRSRSGNSDFSDEFSGLHAAPFFASDPGNIQVRVYVDHSSLEVFLDGGKLVFTEIFFPDEPYSRISLYSKEGITLLKGGTIHRLKNTWVEL